MEPITIIASYIENCRLLYTTITKSWSLKIEKNQILCVNMVPFQILSHTLYYAHGKKSTQCKCNDTILACLFTVHLLYSLHGDGAWGKRWTVGLARLSYSSIVIAIPIVVSSNLQSVVMCILYIIDTVITLQCLQLRVESFLLSYQHYWSPS